MFSFFRGPDIAIDLGTTNVLVYVKGRGIVLNEPSVIAVDKATRQIVAVGDEARPMIGRTPGNLYVIRPLREGVIADYEATEEMIRYFVQKAVGKSLFFKPRIMICIPSGVTDVEKRAVLEAAAQAGGGKVYLIEEPIAAAMGAALAIGEAMGNMVIDIGGGTTDVAVLSLGGIVTSDSVRVGGDRFDESIVRYVKKEYNLLIGDPTAEEVKVRIGTAKYKGRNEFLEIRGRDLVSGLPKVIRITSAETREALAESVNAIVESVKTVLEATPPELSADIIERGMVMTGGGALLFGLDEVISQVTGIPVTIADDTLSCVVLGSGNALENLDSLKEGIVYMRKA